MNSVRAHPLRSYHNAGKVTSLDVIIQMAYLDTETAFESKV